MLDIASFIVEKGGGMHSPCLDLTFAEPDLIRESQRRRGAPVEAVDQVIGKDSQVIAI